MNFFLFMFVTFAVFGFPHHRANKCKSQSEVTQREMEMGQALLLFSCVQPFCPCGK